jgi:hypothetical protein
LISLTRRPKLSRKAGLSRITLGNYCGIVCSVRIPMFLLTD